MAARKRAQERDFNRRRHLILDKGFELAYNQKDTALGNCLLDWNVKEAAAHERIKKKLQRQEDIASSHKDQEKRKFVIVREESTREPTLILERIPNENQYPNYVNYGKPRFMRQLQRNQISVPEFPTFSTFRAVRNRKQNVWEERDKRVQFRPTLCPSAKLNDNDTNSLSSSWAQVNEMHLKSLGKMDSTKSRTEGVLTRPSTNPLSLPTGLQSVVVRMATQCIDELPPSTVSDTTSQLSDSELEEDPVFITQLGYGDAQHRHRAKKKLARQRERHEQIEHALVSIHDYLNRNRVEGKPMVRHINHGNRRIEYSPPTTASSSSTIENHFTLPKTAPNRVTFNDDEFNRPKTTPKLKLQTNCQSAENIKILESVRKVTLKTAHSNKY